MTTIIIFLDITDSPMLNPAKPMRPIGSFTISRTAAWHDRQSLPFIVDGGVGRSVCAAEAFAHCNRSTLTWA
jgi:hypothetical protein